MKNTEELSSIGPARRLFRQSNSGKGAMRFRAASISDDCLSFLAGRIDSLDFLTYSLEPQSGFVVYCSALM